MGFRFRRRVKIIPGVTLNLGKTGVSVSAGVRGAKVTVGKNGVRQTVGLPGTGLSHTTYTKYGNKSVSRPSCVTPSKQQQSNITVSGVFFVIGFMLLMVFVAMKSIIMAAIVGVSATYFVWKWTKKPDAGIEQATQTQSGSLSQSDKNAIEASARSMVRVVNESLILANESKNYDTRVSRIQVAKDTLAKLQELTLLHPAMTLTSLDAVTRSIEEVERETREYAK